MHPGGAFLYAKIFNKSAHITGAKLKVFNRNIDIILYIITRGFVIGLRRMIIGFKHNRNLFRNTEHTVTIGAVSGYFKIDNNIIKP